MQVAELEKPDFVPANIKATGFCVDAKWRLTPFPGPPLHFF
jgi:hypothetical protein